MTLFNKTKRRQAAGWIGTLSPSLPTPAEDDLLRRGTASASPPPPTTARQPRVRRAQAAGSRGRCTLNFAGSSHSPPHRALHTCTPTSRVHASWPLTTSPVAGGVRFFQTCGYVIVLFHQRVAETGQQRYLCVSGRRVIFLGPWNGRSQDDPGAESAIFFKIPSIPDPPLACASPGQRPHICTGPAALPSPFSARGQEEGLPPTPHRHQLQNMETPINSHRN